MTHHNTRGAMRPRGESPHSQALMQQPYGDNERFVIIIIQRERIIKVQQNLEVVRPKGPDAGVDSEFKSIAVLISIVIAVRNPMKSEGTPNVGAEVSSREQVRCVDVSCNILPQSQLRTNGEARHLETPSIIERE